MLEAPIQLLKPDVKKQRTSLFIPSESFRIKSPVNYGWWGAYTKHVMVGELGSPRRKVNLVKKDVFYAVEYYRKWRLLKKIGIPTVESMRVAEDERHVLMTDYSALKAQSYGRERYENWDDLHKPEYLKEEINTLDSIFAKIPINAVTTEIRRIEALASKNGILFPEDDPLDVFVFPDGSWTVMILDLSQLEIIPLSEFDSEHRRTNMKLMHRSIWQVECVHRNVNRAL